MKFKTIEHTQNLEINKLVDFMHKSEALYNKSPTTKESHLYLLKLFFSNKTIFLISENEKEEFMACASISIDENYPKIAFLGHYHLPINLAGRDDIKKSFFNFIYSYCKKMNLSNIFGPINFNTWLNNRFVYPIPEKLYSWEPKNPSLYPEDFFDEKFEIDKKYFTYFLEGMEVSRLTPLYDQAIEQGFQISEIDINNPDHQMDLYQLNCECFAENYFFSEISFEQYKNSILKSIEGLDLRYSFFIGNSERKWGYIFNIPQDEFMVIKTILVSPKSRASGLASALIFKSITLAQTMGFTKTIGALIREGNASQKFLKKGSNIYKTHEYFLLKKEIK